MTRNRNRTVAIWFSSLVLIANSHCLRADEPESFKVPADSVAIELSRLAAEYERLNNVRRQALEAAKDVDGAGKPADETLSDEGG
jgi:hypothetical protein